MVHNINDLLDNAIAHIRKPVPASTPDIILHPNDVARLARAHRDNLEMTKLDDHYARQCYDIAQRDQYIASLVLEQDKHSESAKESDG